MLGAQRFRGTAWRLVPSCESRAVGSWVSPAHDLWNRLRPRTPSTRLLPRSWWRQVYHDSPMHVVIETTLILVVLYILLFKRSYDPAKR